MKKESDKIFKVYEFLKKRSLLDWQKKEIEKYLNIENGLPYLLMAPRRNGKSEVVKALCFYYFLKGKKILYTSHDLNLTTANYFETIESIPEKYLSRKNSARLNFANVFGGEMQFLTRGTSSRMAGVGTGWDLLIIDEVQQYRSSQKTDLEATVATSDFKAKAIIYTGTAPRKSSSGDVINQRIISKDENVSYFGIDEFCEKPTKEIWSKKTVNPSYDVLLHDHYFENLLYLDIENEIYGNLDDFNNEQLGFNQQRQDVVKYAFSNEKINKLKTKYSKNNAHFIDFDKKVIAIRHDLASGVLAVVECFTEFDRIDKYYVECIIATVCTDAELMKIADVIWDINPDLVFIDANEEFDRILKFLKVAKIESNKILKAGKTAYVANFQKLKNAVDRNMIELMSDKCCNVLKNIVENEKNFGGLKGYLGTSNEYTAYAYAMGISILAIDKI